MKSTAFALFALFCIMGAGIGGGVAQAKVIDPASPLNEPVQSSLIGRSVLIEEITKCQRAWMKLEPIFSSGDIGKTLANESIAFQDVDRLWKTTME